MNLQFKPMSELPVYRGDCSESVLLLNPCDGYHLMYANFNMLDLSFNYFGNFTGTEKYEGGWAIAWAILECPVDNGLVAKFEAEL